MSMETSDGACRYEIDGFTVVFTPWHSEYLDEDFVAISVLDGGREVLHAGMTHANPSEYMAQKEVDLLLAMGGDAE